MMVAIVTGASTELGLRLPQLNSRVRGATIVIAYYLLTVSGPEQIRVKAKSYGLCA